MALIVSSILVSHGVTSMLFIASIYLLHTIRSMVCCSPYVPSMLISIMPPLIICLLHQARVICELICDMKNAYSLLPDLQLVASQWLPGGRKPQNARDEIRQNHRTNTMLQISETLHYDNSRHIELLVVIWYFNIFIYNIVWQKRHIVIACTSVLVRYLWLH
jgi:hypothetical protein